ncbi:MAG TPA: polysaccharide deacetylase family protein [Burkholderiaceae bacterium]|nr:polysaccharide deacetylase family protein [Burkholderiaceae bacterium]
MKNIKRTVLDVCSRVGVFDIALKKRRWPPLILMYHGVTRERNFEGLCNYEGKHLPVGRFIAHLSALRRSRTVISLGQLIEGLYNGDDLSNTAAITFDDGYENNASVAAPVLAEFGMRATFFLVSGLIGSKCFLWTDLLELALDRTNGESVAVPGTDRVLPLRTLKERQMALVTIKADLKARPDNAARDAVEKIALQLGVNERSAFGDYRFMTWEQARYLVSAGFEVGAHTVTHPILSRVPLPLAAREILDSKEAVLRETGQCSEVFCFPNGKFADYNASIRNFCRQHFKAALSTNRGAAALNDIYDLKRLSPAGRGNDANLEWALLRTHA